MFFISIRQFAVFIAAAVMCAVVVGCVSDLQAGSLKKSLKQMRYYGGPKSPMWRG